MVCIIHVHSSWLMSGKSLESIAALYDDWWIGLLVGIIDVQVSWLMSGKSLESIAAL